MDERRHFLYKILKKKEIRLFPQQLLQRKEETTHFPKKKNIKVKRSNNLATLRVSDNDFSNFLRHFLLLRQR